MTTSKVLGTITITVTEDSVQYDTGAFSLPDLNFWLDVVKTMLLTSVTGVNGVTPQDAIQEPEPEVVVPQRTKSPLG